ncbi:Xylose operon regulatory protein [Posidoniimonas polymericola]|uniref:Xylose operon regulatory protein n=1 Tax=Posidoniimonas polymericola TaxID=2528002 RepID=A0A5C5YTV4_9BACT|nr:DNA-binding transcriptional regulator [Posidoniimonas polymericola]TWT78429.1 Xylose operon regulatory protein [Posidoniimonas polymericola]
MDSAKSQNASESNGEPSRSPTMFRNMQRVAVLIETDTSSGCAVIRGIADYAERHGGWHLLLDPRDHEHRSALPDGWTGHGIIARLSSRQQIDQVRASGAPVVNVDDIYEDLAEFPMVITDEAALAEQSLTHLLDRGFQQFGYFAPPSTQYSKKRGQAFVKAVEEHGYVCREYKPGYRPGRKIGWVEQQRRVSRWLASLPQPIAILAIDAAHGRQLAEICHLNAFRVPDDIAILAGDPNDVFCEVSTPPLSHVKVASEKIGFTAAEMLDSLISGGQPPESAKRISPHGIAARQSTDLLAIDDPMIVDALRFIRAHAHRGIAVVDILREIPISRRGLEIQFRNYLGRSPAKEIRRVQLERGRELLAKRELSISEVAHACGFANATRFGVAFKKEVNTTPLAYRRELLAGQKDRDPGY